MSEQPTVASLAQLYLGNLLYSLETTAMSLDDQNRPADAAFYRGIARELAAAHGRGIEAVRGGQEPSSGS